MNYQLAISNLNHSIADVSDSVARNLLRSEPRVVGSRVLTTNASSGQLTAVYWWTKPPDEEDLGIKKNISKETQIRKGLNSEYPW